MMLLLMGAYGGQSGNSTSDDDQQDEIYIDQQQTEVDEFTEDAANEDSDASAGAASLAFGLATLAGAGAAGSGAGGAGNVPSSQRPTEAEEDLEDPADSDEIDETVPVHEPDTEPVDGPTDPGHTKEVEERENGQEEEQEQSDEQERDDPDDDLETEHPDEVESDDDEQEKDEDDEDTDDEDEDETVDIVIETDALSAVTWAVQPTLLRIRERYGDQVNLTYKSAPVREFGGPEEGKQDWIEAATGSDMPIDPSFWEQDAPTSTELVNKAFEAASRQEHGEEYLRALWRHGVAAGRSLADPETLIDVATEVGLSVPRFERTLSNIEPRSRKTDPKVPVATMEIHGNTVKKSGWLHYADFKTQLTFAGLQEQPPQELAGFVAEYGPVATREIMAVYEIERDEAGRRLHEAVGSPSFQMRDEQFWE